jgi:Na+/citrate or Na+/malate symporter
VKKILLFALLALLLVGCSPAAIQRVVTLPDPLRIAIESIAVFAVGWLFAQIGMRLPWFVKLFGQYADEIAFALSGAVLATIQNFLNLIPAQWETPANLFLAFIVAVLAALQVFRLLGKRGVKTFRA